MVPLPEPEELARRTGDAVRYWPQQQSARLCREAYGKGKDAEQRCSICSRAALAVG